MKNAIRSNLSQREIKALYYCCHCMYFSRMVLPQNGFIYFSTNVTSMSGNSTTTIAPSQNNIQREAAFQAFL
jgi:hypothetical protein